MKIALLSKGKVIALAILFIGAGVLSNVSAFPEVNTQLQIRSQTTANGTNEGTEYWALLVAVGVYADNPREDRPLMLEEVDDFYKVLLKSDLWEEDHIKLIKGEDATVMNIIKGLRWLDSVEDSDDVSLVYITTHGFPLGFDIPPSDEDDGTDEGLVSYWGFAYTSLFIWDDELNFLLNRLESQGVCLIVDSCYAGGFNDPPDWNASTTETEQAAEAWMRGFAEDVKGQGRVVLMASHEDEVSFSGGFAPYLIDGLRGYADSNQDNIISAEEAFYYTEPRTSRQHPTMYDGYEGDLPLVDLNSCSPQNEVQGLGQKNQGDYKITSPSGTLKYQDSTMVCGYVTDNDTEDPLEDAQIQFRGRDNEGNFYENETLTDSQGFYNMNVRPGRGHMSVHAEGYCSGESGFLEIEEDEILWVNFSLYPRPEESSTICGYVIDNDTSFPINDARITLFWEGEQQQYYWNETTTDTNGFYQIQVAAGRVDLEVEAYNYFSKEINNIIISDDEHVWLNFSLTPRPEENALICGYITDKETSTPLENVHLTFLWTDVSLGYRYENETHTDENGFYTINIAAGEIYHDLREHGYEYYNPYRLDTEEYETLWFNISLIEDTIDLSIAKPLTALYLLNQRIIPFIKTRIIGPIDIEAYVGDSWYGQASAEKVEFYIDNELKATLTTEPFLWTWTEKRFGKHTIKVVAYDSEGKSVTQEKEVFKFL
jgi:hypothetical protein